MVLICCVLALSICSCDPPGTNLIECNNIGYLTTLRFVIKDKNTSENLITKGVYKKETIRLFYKSASGTYDTLYNTGAVQGGLKDTVAVSADNDHPIFSQSAAFYIKYDASDIDTLKISASADHSDPCKTEYTLKQFWINGKMEELSQPFSGTFVIYKQ